ncbi:MAG: 2,4-dienoyl-CoA reductase [Calditrichaeota bacterium]|nr:MAG: 2,4-dienoyl-CoA reductase [Calditrichota bacterium]
MKDQVAVITGGGTGLGKEIARQFARHGARIVICSRNEEHLQNGRAEIEQEGQEVMTYRLDVREPQAIQAMGEAIRERFGRIDILVNNAAGNFIYPAEKLPLKGWKAVIDIVLNGTFYCSQILGQAMIERKAGQILNILATYAWHGGPGTIHSACAKAGVLAMTRTLAVEWARYGIRVNAIAPGPFDTEGARVRLWPTEEMRKAITDSIPLKRFADPEEVARAALFLVSPYADYITGECLTIDGGAWLGRGIGNVVENLDQFAQLREAGKREKHKQ